MTAKGGAVITERQLRNDSRGRGRDLCEKGEKGKSDAQRANSHSGLDISRREELSEDAIIQGEICEKYNTADDTIKWSRGRSRQEGDLKSTRETERSEEPGG